MKKLFLIFLMALMLGACASVTYNANGQRIKACSTDFECLQRNGF